MDVILLFHLGGITSITIAISNIHTGDDLCDWFPVDPSDSTPSNRFETETLSAFHHIPLSNQ